jgi:putative acetyltransferase
MVIRAERRDDYPAIRYVNELAFCRTNEADLIDALRVSASPLVSLVAVENDQVVGHILFSPVSVESESGGFTAMGLGPMSVLPEHQNRGIGSSLVQEGLKECTRIDHQIVFVVGHPQYYPRFGFISAKQKGFSCEFAVPDEVFMVAELKLGAMSGWRGLVKYHPAFTRHR